MEASASAMGTAATTAAVAAASTVLSEC